MMENRISLPPAIEERLAGRELVGTNIFLRYRSRWRGLNGSR